MREQAERLIQHLNNPTYWGSGHETNPDPTSKTIYVLDIWRWAEDVGRRDIQAEIARVAAPWQRYVEGALARNEKLTLETGPPIPQLDAIIRQFAAEARTAGHWKEYAGFLEAIWYTADRAEQPAMLWDLIDAYARAGNTQRQVWHMAHLARTEVFQGKFDNARQLLRDAHRLSLNPRFDKGIGMILMSVAYWLEKDGRVREAHRCLVAARALFRELHDIFTITARDLYHSLEVDHPSAFTNGETLPSQTADELLTAFFAEADST
jgi:hypothetical protein